MAVSARLPEDELQRERDLVRMKRIATGLLVGATVVFLVTRALEDDVSGLSYVRATAEAAMVGALADWFAVTALFRHPLGIPIPHTAIIPNRKDDIGRGLGTFVERNFLTADVVTERLRGTPMAARLGAWLAEPANAQRVGDQAATVLTAMIDALQDDEVQDAIEQALAHKLRGTPAGPILGKGLDLAIADGRHQQLLSTILRPRRRVARRQPRHAPHAPRIRVAVVGARHRRRPGLRTPLRRVAAPPRGRGRRSRPRAAGPLRRADAAAGRRSRVVARDAGPGRGPEGGPARPPRRCGSGRARCGPTSRRRCWPRASDPSSELRQRIEAGLAAFGARLRDDPSLQKKVDEWIVSAAGGLVEQSREEVGELIASTVARWDPAESSRRIELQVGRDLQFIRINGTVVGGLAGLVIHLVGQLIG